MNTNEIDMTGQWFGQSVLAEPKSNSLIVVNIEPRFPKNAILLGLEYQTQIRTVADAIMELKGEKFVGKTFNYRIYNQNNHTIIPLAMAYNSGAAKPELPREAEYEAKFDGKKLEGTYKNNLGQTGNFQLWRTFSEATQGPPIPQSETIAPLTWDEFKNQIGKFRSKGKILFRGQHSNVYPLRTSFHRKERNNLPRYLQEEVSRLRHQINAISPHYYQQTSEDLYGLLNLAQHHGFPTPYLTRIDILASERAVVEDELRFMGITPATLFPGFEGACKSLRDELFS